MNPHFSTWWFNQQLANFQSKTPSKQKSSWKAKAKLPESRVLYHSLGRATRAGARATRCHWIFLIISSWKVFATWQHGNIQSGLFEKNDEGQGQGRCFIKWTIPGSFEAIGFCKSELQNLAQGAQMQGGGGLVGFFSTFPKHFRRQKASRHHFVFAEGGPRHVHRNSFRIGRTTGAAVGHCEGKMIEALKGNDVEFVFGHKTLSCWVHLWYWFGTPSVPKLFDLESEVPVT